MATTEAATTTSLTTTPTTVALDDEASDSSSGVVDSDSGETAAAETESDSAREISGSSDSTESADPQPEADGGDGTAEQTKDSSAGDKGARNEALRVLRDAYFGRNRGPDSDNERAEPDYRNRSPNSVFPLDAFYDHAAIEALFPRCPPPSGGSLSEWAPWIGDVLDYWDKTYARWDTDSGFGSSRVATGWWTDEQLEMWLPGSGITAASAGSDIGYHYANDTLGLWISYNPPADNPRPYYYPYMGSDGTYTFEDLYRRIEPLGYRYEQADPDNRSTPRAYIRDEGIPGSEPNPRGVDVTQVMLEWMLTRYVEPPTKREPSAWAMRTLLDAHDPSCVKRMMRRVCAYDGNLTDALGEQAAEVLDRSHHFGRVLWSLVCPEK